MPCRRELLAERLAYSVDVVKGVENGTYAARIDRYMGRWAEVFGLDDELRALWARVRDERAATWSDQGRTTNRRRRARGEGQAGAGDVALGEHWDLIQALDCSSIGARALDQLETRVAELAGSYPSTPPAGLRDPVFWHIGKVVDLLRGPLPVEHRRRVVIVLSVLAGVAGNLLFDLKDHSRARHSFENALAAAKEAADPDLHAWVLAMHSLIPTYDGRPSAALKLIEEARQVADGRVTPSRSAWLDAFAARAYAGLGDAKRCGELLQSAWQSMSEADRLPRRSGIDFFDVLRLKGLEGTCLLLLKQPRGAQPVLAEVLALRDPADIKGRALARVDLALSQVQQREVEAACRMLRDVLSIEQASLVGPIIRRVEAVRIELTPWGDMAAVRELDELLRLVA